MNPCRRRLALVFAVTVLATAPVAQTWSKGLVGRPEFLHWLGYRDDDPSAKAAGKNGTGSVNLRTSGLLVATGLAAVRAGDVNVFLDNREYEPKAVMAFPEAGIVALAFELPKELPVVKTGDAQVGDSVTIFGATGFFEVQLTRGIVSKVSPVEKGGVFYVDVATSGRVTEGIVVGKDDMVLGIVTMPKSGETRIRCISLAAIEQLLAKWQDKVSAKTR